MWKRGSRQAQAARRLTCAWRCNVSGLLLLPSMHHLQVVVATSSSRRVSVIALYVVWVPVLGMPVMSARRWPGMRRAGRLAHRRCCVRSHTNACAARRTRDDTIISDACRLLLRGRSLETNTLVTSEPLLVANALRRQSQHGRARRARRCKNTEVLLCRDHRKPLVSRSG